MPIPTDYKDIVKAMHTATDEGRVKWVRQKGEYVVTTPNARIMVSSGTDSVLRLDFVGFTLCDENNKLIDGWAIDRGDEDYDTMHSLANAARRAASNLSPTLQELKELFLHSPSIGEDGDAPIMPADRYGT